MFAKKNCYLFCITVTRVACSQALMRCPFVFPFAHFSIRCCNQRRNEFFLPGKYFFFVEENIFFVWPTALYSSKEIIRVASRFGILVRYRSVFSRYFTDRYQRKTWWGRFGIVHLAGTPFFLQREASAPFLMDQAPLLREKYVPAKFTKRSSCIVSQNEVPAKS